MTTETRRAIAFVAGSVATGSRPSSIYDYSTRKYTNMSGNVGPLPNVNLYDFEARAHIGGTLPSLFHYGTRSHLQLKMDGSRFSGFDYGTRSHFSGSVNGRSVSLFDYSTRKYYNFSV